MQKIGFMRKENRRWLGLLAGCLVVLFSVAALNLEVVSFARLSHRPLRSEFRETDLGVCSTIVVYSFKKYGIVDAGNLRLVFEGVAPYAEYEATIRQLWWTDGKIIPDEDFEGDFGGVAYQFEFVESGTVLRFGGIPLNFIEGSFFADNLKIDSSDVPCLIVFDRHGKVRYKSEMVTS